MKTSLKSIVSIMIIGFMMTNLFSCKDKDDSVNSQEILGKWNWVSTNGGFTGVMETPTSTGLNVSYVFKSDLSFEEEINGTTTRTGTYNIFSDNSILNGQEGEFISFTFDNLPEPSPQYDYLVIADNYLITNLDIDNGMSFGNDYVDGFDYSFEKQE